MTRDDMATQLVCLAKSLFDRGYAVGGAGNISVRLVDGSILATPTNSCLGRLQRARLSLCDTDGRVLEGDPPTKELPLHLAVYRARPSCGAIVHLHSTYTTALSCLADLDPEDALRPFTPYYVMKVGRLPVIPYARPGADALAAGAMRVAGEHPAFLLANHGAVVSGPGLLDAVNAAEELEETAKLHFVLQSSGRPVRYLTQPQIRELVKG